MGFRARLVEVVQRGNADQFKKSPKSNKLLLNLCRKPKRNIVS